MSEKKNDTEHCSWWSMLPTDCWEPDSGDLLILAMPNLFRSVTPQDQSTPQGKESFLELYERVHSKDQE